jgi:hypothetical protein
MPSEQRQLPSDPLRFVKTCLSQGYVLWTYHVNMRMGKRPITRDRLLASIESFEIIEENPMDKYLPSYLVRAEDLAGIFHVLVAADVPGDNVRIITMYVPDPQKWDNEFRHRSHQQ